MLPAPLSDQIDAHRIGPKLQRLRRVKGLGLTQLGEHKGLYPS